MPSLMENGEEILTHVRVVLFKLLKVGNTHALVAPYSVSQALVTLCFGAKAHVQQQKNLLVGQTGVLQPGSRFG